MTYTARWTKAVIIAVLAVSALIHTGQARAAADLPLAAASPLVGVAFDDRPLLLPVQRNFQMAMLTTSSELGRSCGKMEAYGWRMSQVEQNRVNQIFNNTVDRLRLMGYSITPQSLSSVSKDITLFTADNPEKHFLFLWSAGELGLVLNICQTTAPAGDKNMAQAMELTPSVQVFPILSNDVVKTDLEAVRPKGIGKFTPTGTWTGNYTCAQGYTGGTLKIGALRGKNFEGEFRFYPTPKNPSVTHGAYTVYGQYDAGSQRILINPGKWIERPANYFYTVMVGNFDPLRDTFSAYFQGINGCTSFEAARSEGGKSSKYDTLSKPAAKKKKRVVKKKPVAITDPTLAPISMDVTPAPITPQPVTQPVPVAVPAMAVPASVPAAAPVPVAAPVPAAAPLPADTTPIAPQPASAPPTPLMPRPVSSAVPVAAPAAPQAAHAPSAMVMPTPSSQTAVH